MSGVVRACLLVGAAAKLSVLLEVHTKCPIDYFSLVENAPKLAADLKNKVANVSGLNSTAISVLKPETLDFYFPCPEILAAEESKSETVLAARQLRGRHEMGFLSARRGFPLVLEVDGSTSGKLFQDLRAHAKDLSTTACETAHRPCKVSFELHECSVREGHYRRPDGIPPCVGFFILMANICCMCIICRVIRKCCVACCSDDDEELRCPAHCIVTYPAAEPFLAAGHPAAEISRPATEPPMPTGSPAPTAPAPAEVQPARVYPSLSEERVYSRSSAEEAAQLEQAVALSIASAQTAAAQTAAAIRPAVAPAAPPSCQGYCSTCGGTNPEHHRFCGHCGNALQLGVTPAAGLQLTC